jgi:hypothetical protein
VPIGRRRFCSELCSIRGQRSERVYDTGQFGRYAINAIRSMARRVGASDIAELGLMWEIMAEAENATFETLTQLREGTQTTAGFSWGVLAAEIGVTRQALSQWYARREGKTAGGRNDVLRSESLEAAEGTPVHPPAIDPPRFAEVAR